MSEPRTPRPAPTPAAGPTSPTPAASSSPNAMAAQQLVDRLLTLWPMVPPESRAALVARLAAGGVVDGAQLPGPPAALSKLCDVKPEAALPPGGVLDVLLAVLKFVQTVERVAWTAWRTVAPQSPLKASGDLCMIVGRSLQVPAEDNRRIADAELQKLGQLIAGILSAVPSAIDVSIEHWRHLMPKEIRKAIEAEQGGRSGRQDALCWRKYAALAQAFEESDLSVEVRRAVAAHVDRTISRPGGP